MSKKNKLFYGRLGKDPELKYTTEQAPICYLSMAINKDGEQKADWNRVVVFGKQAELASVQLRKGNELFVQGQRSVKEFKGNDGKTRISKEIKARLIGFSNL